MKKIVLVTIVILGMVIIAIYFFISRPTAKKSDTQANAPTCQTYTNSLYGYKMSYPSDETVSYIAEYDTIPVEQSADPIIYKTGGSVEFGIDVYASSTNTNNSPAAIKKWNSLINLPIRQFAETIRLNQNAGKVSSMSTTTLGGQEAYSFTTTGSFTDIMGGGYLLGTGNIPYNYVFVDDKAGQKFMIRYPSDDATAEQMKSSFQFVTK